MKKKRFYKNVPRNQTWTEAEQGRQIDFADKYDEGGIYSDKFDYLRPETKKKKKKLTPQNVRRFFKKAGVVLLCVAVFCAGYTCMDVYMIRKGMPDRSALQGEAPDSALNEISLGLSAEYIESVSLDGSVMLDAVLSQAETEGCNSVAFDIKRSEGSLGYRSELSVADAYGTVAFPSENLKASVEKLMKSDILTVGIVCCYMDNIVPANDASSAVPGSGGEPYRDTAGNMYLNPDSQYAYTYIKDIISETYAMGVTVFVLTGVDLPDEVSDGYNDGFESLAQRLYSDIGNDIKLLRAVNVRLGENAVLDDSTEIADKLSDDLGDDGIYFISASGDRALIKEKLEESGVSRYILAD